MTPTRAYPPPVPAPSRFALPGVVNFGLAWVVRALVWRVCFADAVGRLRRDLGLASRPTRPQPARLLYCFSPHLLPAPADWPSARIRVTGPWLREGSPGEPDETLRRFVEAGERPVAIGFGSMQVDPSGRAALSRSVLDAIVRCGRRAVVIRGWGAIDLESDGPVLVVDHAPFEWLLPRVAVAVHHGGAGTVAAAARAGVPQVIVPFVADQFFWAWQLRRLGVSPGALSRKALDGRSLAASIEAAAAMRDEAARIGVRMLDENGVATAIEALETWGLLRPETKRDQGLAGET